jgi:hypothetical protein
MTWQHVLKLLHYWNVHTLCTNNITLYCLWHCSYCMLFMNMHIVRCKYTMSLLGQKDRYRLSQHLSNRQFGDNLCSYLAYCRRHVSDLYTIIVGYTCLIATTHDIQLYVSSKLKDLSVMCRRLCQIYPNTRHRYSLTICHSVQWLSNVFV